MGRKINVTNNSVLFKNENNVATNALYFSNDGGVEISGTMLCDVSINNAINRVTFQQLTDKVALQENTITSLKSKLETLKSQINYPSPEPEPYRETINVRISINRASWFGGISNPIRFKIINVKDANNNPISVSNLANNQLNIDAGQDIVSNFTGYDVFNGTNTTNIMARHGITFDISANVDEAFSVDLDSMWTMRYLGTEIVATNIDTGNKIGSVILYKDLLTEFNNTDSGASTYYNGYSGTFAVPIANFRTGSFTRKIRILKNDSIYGAGHLIFNGVQMSTGTVYNSNSEITLFDPSTNFVGMYGTNSTDPKNPISVEGNTNLINFHSPDATVGGYWECYYTLADAIEPYVIKITPRANDNNYNILVNIYDENDNMIESKSVVLNGGGSGWGNGVPVELIANSWKHAARVITNVTYNNPWLGTGNNGIFITGGLQSLSTTSLGTDLEILIIVYRPTDVEEVRWYFTDTDLALAFNYPAQSNTDSSKGHFLYKYTENVEYSTESRTIRQPNKNWKWSFTDATWNTTPGFLLHFGTGTSQSDTETFKRFYTHQDVPIATTWNTSNTGVYTDTNLWRCEVYVRHYENSRYKIKIIDAPYSDDSNHGHNSSSSTYMIFAEIKIQETTTGDYIALHNPTAASVHNNVASYQPNKALDGNLSTHYHSANGISGGTGSLWWKANANLQPGTNYKLYVTSRLRENNNTAPVKAQILDEDDNVLVQSGTIIHYIYGTNSQETAEWTFITPGA